MIIDAYVHIGKTDTPVVEGVQTFLERGCNVDNVLSTMNLTGIGKSVIIPTYNWEYLESNCKIAKIVDENPDRFIGFARVNPNCPDCAYDEASEAVNNLDLKGIELSGFNWVNYDPAIANPLLTKLFNLNVPILVRADLDTGLIQRSLPQIVSLFRDKKIIAVLSPWTVQGLFYPPYREILIDLTSISKNLFFIASTVVMAQSIKEIITRVGSEQIIFGSNSPYNSPMYEIERIKSMGLSKEREEQIMHGNIDTILGVK